MAAVKRRMFEDLPGQDNYRNLTELRSNALNRLTAAIVSSAQKSNSVFQLTRRPLQANHIDSNLTPPPSPPRPGYDY
jgi:hypothetical protein